MAPREQPSRFRIGQVEVAQLRACGAGKLPLVARWGSWAGYSAMPFAIGCAISIVGTARTRPDKYPWVTELLGRRPAKVVAVALANKMARTAWAVLAKGETYRAPARSRSAAIVAAA